MTTVEILRKAKAEVKQRGWFRGDFAPKDAEHNYTIEGCPVCAAGAINVAVSGKVDGTDAAGVDLASFMFLAAIDDDYEGDEPAVAIGNWNDAPGRTLAHVLAAFDRAIALASQPHGPGDGNG